MSTVYQFTITGTIIVDDEYAGYSKDDLETEISMGLDETEVLDISNQLPIGSIMTSNIVLDGPMEVME